MMGRKGSNPNPPKGIRPLPPPGPPIAPALRLNFDPKSDPDQLKRVLEKAMQEFPVYVQMQAHVARCQWAKYQALKKEGFTDQQALELCKSI